jgi:hypothetical protein
MANTRAHRSRLIFKGCKCLKCYVWPWHEVLLSNRYRTGLCSRGAEGNAVSLLVPVHCRLADRRMRRLRSGMCT